LFPALSNAGNYTPIIDQIKPNTFTIIGEQHKHPESIALFQALITDYLKQGKCLTIALEIKSNQQAIIDQIPQGRATAADLEIAPMIDHLPFRKMINDLSKLQKNGSCLKLIAIDAGIDIDLSRDEWMAVKLAEQGGERPILVLLGSLHTLKKVHWDLSMTKDSPSVAEIMTSQGYHVKSYPQRWENKNCDHPKHLQSRYIKAADPEALVLLNDSLISLLNAFKYKTAVNVVDGIILWECTP